MKIFIKKDKGEDWVSGIEYDTSDYIGIIKDWISDWHWNNSLSYYVWLVRIRIKGEYFKYKSNKLIR